jgi:cytochrome c553
VVSGISNTLKKCVPFVLPSQIPLFFAFAMPLRFLIALTLLCAGHLAAAAVFEDNMAQRTKACTSCHGEQGRAGPDGYYPRLAGKPSGYLYNQLLNIRDGRRHYQPMASLLEPLADAYLLDMAQYFSGLGMPYPAPAPSSAPKVVLERGRMLVTKGDLSREIPPCQQCHGKALTGTEPHVPGLLGLPRDYLNAQLGGWRTGQRRAQSPDCMGHIAGRLSSEDVAAVTYWLAAQPLPANTKPQPHMTPWPAGVKEMLCGSATALPAKPTATSSALTALTAQGAYLARVGNCQTCHTAPGGAPYAGGRPIDTPFGTAFSGNLTSDKATGLGMWNAGDFWQALHHGKSRDGRLLNPAFPYTEYSRVTRTDSDAMFAYFQTLTPVTAPNRPHVMRWPFGTQAALMAWRTLYFSPQVFAADANESAEWNRGAYLVNGLGHCGTCHTPRNALGASQSNKSMSGGLIPVQNWYAPSLLWPSAGGIDGQNQADTLKLLKSGVAKHGTANGPMALVVQGSTQHMTDTDLQAMAVYLQSVAIAPPHPAVTSNEVPMPASLKSGGILYDTHCTDCHGTSGQGVPGAYPALAGNRAVLLADSSNLIQSVLHGGFSPVTATHAQPFGMPPFVLKLSDQDIAQVLTFVRNAWGNQATAVTKQEVSRLRDRQTH